MEDEYEATIFSYSHAELWWDPEAGEWVWIVETVELPRG